MPITKHNTAEIQKTISDVVSKDADSESKLELFAIMFVNYSNLIDDVCKGNIMS